MGLEAQELNNIKLANKIREARLKLRFTQREFAEALGKNEKSIYLWEGSRVIPSMKNLKKIEKLTGVKFDDVKQAKEDNAKVSLKDAIEIFENIQVKDLSEKDLVSVSKVTYKLSYETWKEIDRRAKQKPKEAIDLNGGEVYSR